MRRPGDRLRAFAARACSADTMARLIDPVIADLQVEYSQALRQGRTWRSRWVRLAGYVAFAKVFVICEWSAVEDTRPLIRIVGFSLAAIALATAVLVAIPYFNQFAYAPSPAIMLLFPQALAVSIPVGLMIGVAIGLLGQSLSVRLATVVGAIALACSMLRCECWMAGLADQAFRTAAMSRTIGQPPPRGQNELTLAELNRDSEEQWVPGW